MVLKHDHAHDQDPADEARLVEHLVSSTRRSCLTSLKSRTARACRHRIPETAMTAPVAAITTVAESRRARVSCTRSSAQRAMRRRGAISLIRYFTA
ncbi:hypothetical protein Bphy_7267 (plasmid) [Paraburkholderia phymatum STM815]|uniref:Uncharacterized protein n=1 Tax=Paraburkholderia phymatum (strain DSM 17167 / CIP 108236 / LMG 21445 / STM815) TaxID=391038 RepID=B2JXA3_PARP8|nr:hypothetical protein Bphy_7267 [Paraburkholderia phymatum STM815]